MHKVKSVRNVAIAVVMLGIASAVFATSALAGSLMSEPFSYVDGGIVAVSAGNWTTHSGTGTDIQVVSGTAVGIMSQFPDDNRLLSSPRSSTDKTYACFSLVIPTPSQALVCNYFAHFMVNSSTFRSKVFITPSGGSYTVGLSVTANAAGSPLAPPVPPLGATWPSTLSFDQAYNIVISYDAVGGISELWVDPVDESSPKITATDAPAGNGALTAFGLRESNTSGAAFTWIVDDLSVGTTFDDACGPPAPQPEACCFIDGGCVVLLPEECIAQGGTPQGPGTDCGGELVACPVFGACCFADGSCQELSDIDCLNAGGTFQGGGTACNKGGSNCPQPPQACCFADGSCQDLSPDECFAAGGFPQGGGSACAGFVCPQPLQACCFPNGGCVDADVQVCIDSGGTPQGAGSSCATVICPPATEACCYIDGFCADLTTDECTSTGGVPQGAGTSCATTFCPPPPPVGACCLADGTCVDGIYETDCAALGGSFNVGLLCQEVQCLNATEPKSWGGIKGQYR